MSDFSKMVLTPIIDKHVIPAPPPPPPPTPAPAVKRNKNIKNLKLNIKWLPK